VKHSLGLAGGVGNRRFIADIANHSGNLARMPFLEPFEVAVDTRAGQGIIDQNIVPLARKMIGEIGANEASPACHQNWATTENGWRGSGCV
jgi:hypothetical protein